MAAGPDPSRHLGLDLGATNLKWVVVERHAEDWQDIAHGQVSTRAAGGPAAIVEQLAEVGHEALIRWPDLASVGVGVPGLYDPATGSTRFLRSAKMIWS